MFELKPGWINTLSLKIEGALVEPLDVPWDEKKGESEESTTNRDRRRTYDRETSTTTAWIMVRAHATFRLAVKNGDQNLAFVRITVDGVVVSPNDHRALLLWEAPGLTDTLQVDRRLPPTEEPLHFTATPLGKDYGEIKVEVFFLGNLDPANMGRPPACWTPERIDLSKIDRRRPSETLRILYRE